MKNMNIKPGDTFDLMEVKKNLLDAKVGTQIVKIGEKNGLINTIGESAFCKTSFHPMLTSLFIPSELKKIGTFRITKLKSHIYEKQIKKINHGKYNIYNQKQSRDSL